MRARFVLFAALSLVSALAACGGGGGGGGGGNPPTTSPTATATATATAAASYNPFGCDATDSTPRSAHALAVGVQPTTPTAGYSYEGTLSQTIVRNSPCPVGTATASATVSISVAMSNGGNTETDTETDAYGTNTDEYSTVATVASSTTAVSGANVLTESTETTTDELQTNTSTTTTYGMSPLIYAILSPVPYTANSATIGNDPPSEVKTSLADGSIEDRTYSSATGAYTENDTPAGGGTPNTITVDDSGAATYDVQTPALLDVNGISSAVLSFATPSAKTITVSVKYPGSSQPTPSPVKIPQWWTEPSLYTDTLTDEGAKTSIPCSNANAGASSFEEYERVTTDVDPALGSLDTRTVDEYVALSYNGSGDNVGPVCVTIADDESLFYDLFLDTPQLFYISEDGKPFQTNSISETYWFSAAATGLTRVRQDAASPGVPGLAANVGAHVAGIAFRRSVERAQRLETTLANLRTYGAKHMIAIKAIKGAL